MLSWSTLIQLFSTLIVVLSPLSTAFGQSAQVAPPSEGVLGYWSTDAGSVLQVEPCGESVCIRIVAISQGAPGVLDEENPDPALRTRPLCHLTVGSELKLTDPNHAEDGKIYDPISGKTYQSELSSSGDTLSLRGYIGFKAFGRSETWKRTTAESATCVGTTHR